MLPGAIVLPVTPGDAFRVLRLPLLSVGIAALMLLPGWVTGRGTSLVPLLFALFAAVLGIALAVLEIVEMKSYVISYGEQGIGLARGKHRVEIPWFAVQSVTVLNLVPRKGRARMSTAIEIAVNREGVGYAREAPDYFHSIDVTERESITMFVGSGAKRQEELDRALNAAEVRRYIGVVGYQLDNRRIRYGMDPAVRVKK